MEKEIALSESQSTSPITGFEFNLVYADDISKALAFYEKHLGFVKSYDMNDGSCFGKTGGVGLWIGNGYQHQQTSDRSTRTSVMYGVKSTHQLFEQLKTDGVKIVQDAPEKMRENLYWFQFYDPSGNILEVLGPD